MPKPAAVDANIVSWIRDQHGDTVQAWMRVATVSAPAASPTVRGSVTASKVFDLVADCGRTPGDAEGLLFGSVGAWVLSPSTLRVVRLSGVRERVKHTVFETPRSNLGRLTYRDHRAYGNELRALLLELVDGGFLYETTHLAQRSKPGKFAPQVERFFAAFGPNVGSA